MKKYNLQLKLQIKKENTKKGLINYNAEKLIISRRSDNNGNFLKKIDFKKERTKIYI